jgi:hypothetical protein
MRLLTCYIFSTFSKVGRITRAKGAMAFHVRLRVLWHVLHSTGTGTIATVCMQARAGAEGKGDCM